MDLDKLGVEGDAEFLKEMEMDEDGKDLINNRGCDLLLES
jgi:hypothetical protein